jgi:uncharacterized protein (DUF305 family)
VSEIPSSVVDRSRQPIFIAAAIVAVAITAALGLVVGYRISDDSPSYPDTDSVDAGFARDMSVHHSQAVEMSMIVRDKTDSRDVRSIAYDIALTQEQQIGQMSGWLTVWGVPQQPTTPAMAWMHGGMSGHDMTGMDSMPGMDESTEESSGLMPGMATQAQLAELRAAHGEPAEILFLQLMIRHHLGGIEMAKYAAEHAQTAEVRDLADNMVIAQESEIDAMNDMLVERGAQPIHQL